MVFETADEMDSNSVMQAWAIYKDQVLGFPSQAIYYLDVYATINILNLGVALNNVSVSAKCPTTVIDPSAPTVGRSFKVCFMQAYMLHVAVKWPVHWVRLFLTLMIMVTGEWLILRCPFKSGAQLRTRPRIRTASRTSLPNSNLMAGFEFNDALQVVAHR